MRNTRTVHRWAAMMVAAILMMLAATIASPAQTFRVIHSFSGPPDGGNPAAPLIRDSAGNLYGTTENGGDGSCNVPNGCGTVFKLSKDGTLTVLHAFSGAPDGEAPQAPLIEDPSGNLYGTTTLGGEFGYGTVFEVDAAGNETVLYSFRGHLSDGAYPDSGLIRDGFGDLYGTTSSGGKAGTVFRVSPSGKEIILYSFDGGTDGAHSVAGLVSDSSGNFYGTTFNGGGGSCRSGGNGCGTVFEVSRTGSEAVLYRFTSGADGANPGVSLLRDTAGNLYGTTAYGGAAGGGTVFKLESGGAETVLYSFTGGTDGSTPYSNLVMDGGGDLYGTTSYAGDPSCVGPCGTVFELSPTGVTTVLHDFTDGSDGGWPIAGLIRDSAGNLYGTAWLGGAFGRGVVFGIEP